MKKIIYMDNAATTSVKREVLDEMLPYFMEEFGNPSSIYSTGQRNKKALELARKKIADAISCQPDEIYFTGGGSEADNWAIKGYAEAMSKKGNHIITSKIEHHAVLHTCEYLEKKGFQVTYLDVDEFGQVDLKQLEEAITDKTILISIMYANNEIGTIQPISKIGVLAKSKGIAFHTDAVQATGNVKINVREEQIDMLSMSGHKIYAPKGVGCLYVKKGLRLENLIHGGGQERGRRAGTENIAGIVGFGKAIELAYQNLDEHNRKLSVIRDALIKRLTTEIPHTRLNGHPANRLAGNVNVSFRFVEGESILLMLDGEGIEASSGSACTSGSLDPSHVLLAIGLDHETAHGSLRLSLGDFNSMDEVDYVVEKLKHIIQQLRNMSPLYEKFIRGEV